MSNPNRPRDIEVRLVDSKKLARAMAEAYVAEQNATGRSLDADNIKVEPMQSAIVMTDKGIALVNREGVGTWVNEGTLGVFIPWGGRIDVPVDVVQSAVTDEVENLADFIRTFGDRLEDNFELWYAKAMRAK